jgi:hypothetical protein
MKNELPLVYLEMNIRIFFSHERNPYYPAGPVAGSADFEGEFFAVITRKQCSVSEEGLCP